MRNSYEIHRVWLYLGKVLVALKVAKQFSHIELAFAEARHRRIINIY
jgi:hypothetical protein